MRLIPILSTAVVVVGALATTAEVAGAPPAFESADAAVQSLCAAPPHGVGMRASFPGEPTGGPPSGPGTLLDGPLPPYLHGLTLTDEQQDRVFDLLHGQVPAARQLMRSVQKSRGQLRDLGFSDKYDEAAVRALADVQSKAEADLAVMRAHADHEILALLTSEQRKQVAMNTQDPRAHEHSWAIQGPACWH